MVTTLDGYHVGPEGEFDWPNVDDEFHAFSNRQLNDIDTLLFGRITYKGMAQFWPSPEAKEALPVTAARMNGVRKVVFSSTLPEVGPNARLVGDDVESVVRSLKAETDREISVAGAGLAASLSRLRLVDEYRLYIHPVVLGGGKPYFEAELSLNLKPLGAEQLSQGVTLLRYAPAD